MTNSYDTELFNQDESPSPRICGIDEAGRGPLAGPVCAAAVILPPDFPRDILGDSKKLSEKQRLAAEIIIREQAVWGIGWASAQEIDRYNILQATFRAMRRAVEKVIAQDRQVELLLIDGNRTFPHAIPSAAIIKGDSKVPEIMAASILAKTARDRFMRRMAEKWPEYNFEQHKGYPSRQHVSAYRTHGPCPLHRLSFHVPDYPEDSVGEL
ncbi:ribonuclease HII [Parasphaerochaeta coccoides]|uniref:Ribonuclease HII n=1 Tax=Parasphaerochaeta coccoides (strain ATCC BAA-1237 / DSM 17374 / SPN1) TaxID=760011 RepID=F4GJ95_PARC1|nr:ribonuclease HII [Parasphaerochaeta coccoides]AEC01735.1 Ribonuclease H [Parasphaerochaeta coccoides DSM 17374]